MPTREDYLRFLAENRKSEDDVLALVNLDELTAERLETMIRADPDNAIFGIKYLFENLDQNTNDLLESMTRRLRQDIGDVALGDVPVDTYHGVYPTHDFNAQCRLEGDGYLVLLNTGVMELIEGMIWAWLAYPADERIGFVQASLRGFAMEGTLPNLLQVEDRIDMSASDTAVLMTSLTQKFVIAHEWGHIALGHLDPGNTVRLEASPTSAEVLSKSNKQEYLADRWALKVLIGSAEEHGPEAITLTVAASFFFLGLAGVIEQYYRSDPAGTHRPTHPPALQRVASLEYYMSQRPDSELQFGQEVSAFFDLIHMREFGQHWHESLGPN